MRIHKTTKQIVQYAVVGAIFFFLFRNIYRNWDALRDYEWNLDYIRLCISFLFLFLALTCMVQIWRYILSTLGSHLPFKASWRIWFFSNLGRYLPGKVWQIMGMVYLCEKENVPKVRTFTAIVLGLSLFSLSGLLLMYAYILMSGTVQFAQYTYVFLFFIPCCVVVLYPSVFEKILNFLLRLFKKERIEIRIRFKTMVTLFLLYVLIWGVYGLAFFLFVNSVYPVSYRHFPDFVCIFSASYVIGLLAVFVPAGIGVRESILTTFLSFLIPIHFATVVALLARLWFTAGELAGAAIGLKL
ncbi:MAG: flippase-like domain-containing protein [Gemmatimonadota bacterium]|nr:MAG: flippase-like domain-containing protein [Gemmatimonadota bacterium]